MIYLGNLQKLNDNDYIVGMVHYMPFDKVNGLGKTQTELEQNGMFVFTLEESIYYENKSAVLHCNIITKSVWYEYMDNPIPTPTSEQQEIAELRNQLAQTNADLAMLMETVYSVA